ncbi:D-2-hydroxyacid dehydrogenase [Salinicoccus halitifaciens]|uniref:Phosphoglycerate dehydrogenase-like enzyme n=1 Tax=Salinicoccus halitifaciens TaxID=1073415 RepID=A0ABV2EAM9_9STAP|nr:D-2-hydroxyacid dehydrogenase [Salinicoccus halitifaciens]MCD2137678.1 D-2-hydroxyacid dehydrogenase [Salinicoccus halitifaciens]
MKNIVSTIKLPEKMISRIKELLPGAEYEYVSPKKISAEERGRAEIFITYGTDMEEGHVEEFKNLKWIMVMSAGLEMMPLDKLDDVLITNATGIHKIQMTEYTIGLILSYYKDFYQLYEDQKAGYWRNNAFTTELYDKTLHILGTGSIGSHLAEVLSAFGVNTVGYNTNGRAVEGFDRSHPLDELMDHIGEADILINILPSTDATTGLLTEEHFNAMKDDSVFVNIGRGDVVPDEVLIKVLEEKIIGHLIIDVFNEEPLESDSPFYKYDNITITPHASSKTSGYIERAFDIFEHNIKHLDDISGMKNVIDIEKGY